MANITINRVLEAIIKRNHSGKSISDYTGINKSNLSRYLHFMEDNGFIYLSVNKKAFMKPKGANFYFANTTSSDRGEKENKICNDTNEKLTSRELCEDDAQPKILEEE